MLSTPLAGGAARTGDAHCGGARDGLLFRIEGEGRARALPRGVPSTQPVYALRGSQKRYVLTRRVQYRT